MFRRRELEELASRKVRLIAQSDAHREQLVSDWLRLRSPEFWVGEVTAFSRRHPWWIVTVATAAGTLAAKTLRHPRAAVKKIGRLGKFATAAFSAWKLFRPRR